MKKNQKYTQEDMYLAIELWKESGQSQQEFCRQNKLAKGTFIYWLKKYRKEKSGKPDLKNHKITKAESPFIPLDIISSTRIDHIPDNSMLITITYPTGVQVTCPTGIGVQQLKALINN
jgi:hypothetical protein